MKRLPSRDPAAGGMGVGAAGSGGKEVRKASRAEMGFEGRAGCRRDGARRQEGRVGKGVQLVAVRSSRQQQGLSSMRDDDDRTCRKYATYCLQGEFECRKIVTGETNQ